jgi:DNA polymerase elongation subunit (family B)
LTYVDAWYQKEKDLVRVVERRDGRRVYRDYPAKYVFYYPEKGGAFTSMYGEQLSKVQVTGHKSFDKEKRIHGHKRLHESDYRPLNRCLEDNYLNAEDPKLQVAFFDIEVAFNKERGFADPSDPFNPVTSITVYLDWSDRLVTLVCKPDGMKLERAEEIVSRFDDTLLCATEEELLENFLTLIDDADVMSGWNSEGFDVPYTVNRISRLLGKEYTRQFCLWGQLPQRREFEKYGRTLETFDFIGRVHLDYLELYRKYNYHEMHTYRLDFIGEYELGEKKIQYEGTLDQLYNNDFEKFIAYNRQDVMLLKKLDDKLKFIDLTNLIAHANTVGLRTTLGAVAVTDQAVINEAHRRGMIAADRSGRSDDTAAAGAYVAYPKKGLHEWIGSMDLNSLYPSVIRSLNMSPESIVAQVRQDMTKQMIKDALAEGKTLAEAWEGRFGCPEYEAVMNREIGTSLVLDWENGSSQTMSAAEIYNLVFHSGAALMLSANGTIFNYESKGVIPGLLERWYAERRELQAKAKEAYGTDMFDFWDKRQLVKKINLNSAYGALLNAGSRFFDQRLGQSTTLTGRCIAKHMAGQVNAMITGEHDHVGKAVIYGDTDSVYFSAYPILREEIDSGALEWNKEKVIELYDHIANEVNTTFPGFMSEAFNAPTSQGSLIKAGREVVALKGIFMTKKRYAILVYDQEGKRKDKDAAGALKAMGLDLKRADTPEFMQRFLEECLMMLLTGQTKEDLFARIRKFREEFKSRPGWEKGTPKRVNNLTHHTNVFEKTGKCGIGHALAAINWNRMRRAFSDAYSMECSDGMKVIVCKLKNNPLQLKSIAYPTDELQLPEWFKLLPFDDNGMEGAIIDKKLDNLIGVLDWDISETKGDNAVNFNSLFD